MNIDIKLWWGTTKKVFDFSVYQARLNKKRKGFVNYQNDCRFYMDEFELRDQVNGICEDIFEQAQIRLRTDDEVRGVFIQAGLRPIPKAWRGKAPDNLQEALNEERLDDYEMKKTVERGSHYVN